MDPALILSIVSGLAGVFAAASATGAVVQLTARLIRRAAPPVVGSQSPSTAYGDQVRALTQKLASITGEADKIIAEMSGVVQEQEVRRTQLLEEVDHLTRQEAELKTRLDQMSREDVVGQLIAQQRQHEVERKQDARHDYLLFVLGVGVSVLLTLIAAIIAIETHHLGWT